MAIGNEDGGAKFELDKARGIFFLQWSGPLLQLYVKDSRLFINIILRNRKGQVIGVIEGDTWTMYSDDYEYNNDDVAFELVEKGTRDVYFQVELRKGIAHISGYLINANGKGVCLVPSSQPGWDAMPILDPKTIVKDKGNMRRIFKYPRAKFLSERID